MFQRMLTGLCGAVMVVCFLAGCAEKKKERSVTFEGPDSKTEIKLETTEKKD